jgi:hypothetical protein
MAVLIEGLQGSGKSYYAVYRMHHDSQKYSKIFTNIDGIKTTEKIYSLEFKRFTNDILIDCYNSQVINDGTFEESIAILQKFNILPHDVSKNNRVLIVIDEAQNYFGKSVKLEPALVWFITQHRHLYIELYLITQKYTLLRNDYHLFNLVYKAYSPVKQFDNKKIRYAEYAGLPLSDDNLSKKFTLPKEQQVYSMYISGDKVESPSILKRFLWLFIIMILLLVGAFYLFLSAFLTDVSSEEASNSVLEHYVQLPENNVNALSSTVEKKLYRFVVSDDGYFYVRETESRENYPVKLLQYIKDNYFITVIDKKDMGYGLTIVYVVCKTDLTAFLEPVQSQNKTFSITDISSF